MIISSEIPKPKPTNLQFLREKLVGPSATITEIGARRRAELLAGFSLLMVLSTSAGAIASIAVSPGVLRPSSISLGITAVLTVIAYIFSRTKLYTWGSVLLTFALSLTAFLTLIGGTDTPTATIYSTIPIALLLASALLSSRGLVIALLLNLGGILLLPSMSDLIEMSDITGAVGLIATFGLILIIIGNIRNEIEREHLAELTKTNEELDSLRASLEVRVQERTHELAQEQARTQTILTELNQASRIAQLANFELEPDTQTLVFNEQYFELLGTTLEAQGGDRLPIEQAVQRFVHPDDAAPIMLEVRALLSRRDAIAQDMEYRMIRTDGETRNFLFRFQVERNDHGRPIRARGVVQDITERKQFEETLAQRALELENTTSFLNTIFENLPVMLFMKEAQELRFVRWNETAKLITGFSFEDVQYKNDSDFFPPDEAEFFMSKDREVLESKQLLDIPEEPIQTLHQGLRWLHTRKVPLIGTDGKPAFLLGISEDITVRKQTETILAKRAAQLETIANLFNSIATISDVQEMLQRVTDLTKTQLNLYHVHVYLLNEAGDTLELAAGAGEVGRTMVTKHHAIRFDNEKSLVARAARSRQGVVVNDVAQAIDFLPNPLLPATKAELAVPLITGGRVLGVLDIQADQENAFTDEDVRIQTILAAQIAIVLENARANEQTAKTLKELDDLTRRLTREGWQAYLAETKNQHIGYSFEGNQLINLQDNGQLESESAKTFVQPIELRGEMVGRLVVADAEIEEEELGAILKAVSQGLSAHLENLRLTEEAERRVNELGVVNEIGQTLAEELELQKIIETVVNNLNRAFNANIAYVALYDQENQMIEIPFMLHHGQIIRDEPSYSYGAGINSEIIKTRQAIFINQDTEHRLLELGALPTNNSTISKSFMGVPMITGDKVIGVLSVQDSDREGRFSVGDLNLLKTIAANVAVAIQNARLFADAQKRAEREVMVNLIGQKIQSATTVQGALQTAIQELGLALKAGRTAVELVTRPAEDGEPQKPKKVTNALPSSIKEIN